MNIKKHFSLLAGFLAALMLMGSLAACNTPPAETDGSEGSKITETESKTETTDKTTDEPTATETETEPAPATVDLIKDGKTDYVIVIAADCAPAEQTAANELQEYLAAMSGATLPIVKDSEAKAAHEIVIGETNRAETATYEKEDSLRVKLEGDALYICGGSPRGTLYGVYQFLEHLGCRFFAVDTETVPESKTISLAADTLIEKTPAFDFRDVYWSCAYDPDLSAKLGLNGAVNTGAGRYLTEEQGGGISYAEYLVHSMMYVIPVSMFGEHPEYFCEINGQRYCGGLNQCQPCTSNPEVLQLTITAVRSWLEKYPNAQLVTVSQQDNDYYCRCADCQAIIDEEGSPAGPMIRFANAVADAIAEDYPDVFVDVLAYHYTIEPPKVTKARDNVVVRFCLSNGCVAHAYNDTACAENELIRTALEGWKEVCPRLYVWDYNSNYQYYLCPKPNITLLQENAQFFYENKVIGAFYQGVWNEPNGKSAGFGELRTYLLAKLMWDPYLDFDAVVDEFMAAYYGEGGALIKEYVLYLESTTTAKDYVRVNYEPIMFKKKIAKDKVAYLDGLWTKAKELAAGDPVLLEHIERSEIEYRFIKAEGNAGGALSSAERSAESAKIKEDCKRLGILMWSEIAQIE